MLITLKRLPLGETSGHDETEGSGDINVCALFATHFKTTPNIPPMKKKQKKASQLLIRSATLSVCNKLLWRRARNWTQGEGGLCFRTQVSKQIWNKFGKKRRGKKSPSKHRKGRSGAYICRWATCQTMGRQPPRPYLGPTCILTEGSKPSTAWRVLGSSGGKVHLDPSQSNFYTSWT